MYNIIKGVVFHMDEITYKIKHYKLFDLLNRLEITKGEFREMTGFSPATMAKLSNGKPINTTVINRICAALNCQPADIMEYIPDKPE